MINNHHHPREFAAKPIMEVPPRFPLFLISTTFLWEFECIDGTKVGLAAGRYSGKSRPDRYRTPHALQRVFGPIGPSLHCGVFVTSQCIHFLAESSQEDFSTLVLSLERMERSFLLGFLLTLLFMLTCLSKSDSETEFL